MQLPAAICVVTCKAYLGSPQGFPSSCKSVYSCSFLQDEIHNATTWDMATHSYKHANAENLHSLVFIDNDYPLGKQHQLHSCLNMSQHSISYLQQRAKA